MGLANAYYPKRATFGLTLTSYVAGLPFFLLGSSTEESDPRANVISHYNSPGANKTYNDLEWIKALKRNLEQSAKMWRIPLRGAPPPPPPGLQQTMLCYSLRYEKLYIFQFIDDKIVDIRTGFVKVLYENSLQS